MKKRAFEITGFILGIISLISLILIPVLGIFPGIVGLVFGIIQYKKKNTKLNSAGIILNSLSIVLNILLIISMIIFFSSIKNPMIDTNTMINPKGLAISPIQNPSSSINVNPGIPPNIENLPSMPSNYPSNPQMNFP